MIAIIFLLEVLGMMGCSCAWRCDEDRSAHQSTQIYQKGIPM